MVTYFLNLFTLEEFIKVLIGAIIGFLPSATYLLINKVKVRSKENKCPIIRYNNDNFARETIKYRFKSILMNINNKHENLLDYAEFTNSTINLDFFNNDIFKRSRNGLFEEWINSMNQYKGEKVSTFFINAPFIDVEHFFYYYILNKVNIQQFPKDTIDPFLNDKIALMRNDYCNKSDKHNSKINELLDLGYQIKKCSGDHKQKEQIIQLLKLNLSANSTDLSQLFWEQFSSVTAIIDDSEIFWKDFVSDLHSVNKINILVDNFGTEFLADIIMGYYFILKKGLDANIEIVYHINELPIFVSDVKRGDEKVLLNVLNELVEDNTQHKEVLDDINILIEAGKIKFKSDFFWNMPSSYDTITQSKYKRLGYLSEIKSIFTGNELLIVKGDLNYRRMVGDKNYNPKKKIEKLIKYINCPVLIIRSFKSNVTLLGKTYEEIAKNKNIEQDWQSNGKYGIIQYIKNNSK